MTKAQTVQAVAQQLFAAENAIDLAIAETARLTLRLTEARAGLNLSAVVGTEAFDRAAAVQTGLAAARAEAVALHHALAGVQAQMGLRGVMVGFGDKPPREEDGGVRGPRAERVLLRSA